MNDDGGSVRIDNAIIEVFLANPDNTYLVSFPRTGSHWFRMLAELYFERPTLVRAFYYHADTSKSLLYHTHDVDLSVTCRRVIYLYRDAVETIYSQLRYHQESTDDRERIIYWSDLYGRHVDKWLHQEEFTIQKTVITYEQMKNDLVGVFAKVAAHFDEPFAIDRLERASKQVTKEEVKRKTHHDEQVVQLDLTYENTREQFRSKYADLVWETVFDQRSHLQADFDQV